MTQHPTNQSSVYGVLLRGFVITLVVAANGFQAARAETALSMMEVSDRMPASSDVGRGCQNRGCSTDKPGTRVG